MKILLSIIAAALFFISCGKKQQPSFTLKKIAPAFIDSLKKNNDSTYSKPYKRPDYAVADYYEFKSDSSTAQVMKDSAGQVRQVIISRKNVRIYFAQYYANGQLQADLKENKYGQYEGRAIYYYENGGVKATGTYKDGLSTGEWKEFDEAGKLTATIKYDNYGTRIN